MKRFAIIVLLLSFLCVSCASKGQTGAATGAAGGAILGQVIGGDTKSTVALALFGTLLGYLIGNEMDKADKKKMSQAFETTPAGETAQWVNPDNNNQYKVKPGEEYTVGEKVCRPAEIDAVIDGKPQKTKTKACRNENGEWVIEA